MGSPTIFANLRNILAQLYPDEQGTRRVVADAGLNEISIGFSNRAIDNWHAILTEATKTSKVVDLIAVVNTEYGNYPVFIHAWRDYQVLLEQGVDPSVDDRFPGESPYQGMQYFDVVDASRFFGREQLTAELVSYLCEHRFLAVIGASGSGKSSLVRAGLIPACQCGQPLADGTVPPPGSAHWLIHIITPKAHPLEQLAASLTQTSESVTAQATLMDDLAADSRSLHFYATRLVNRASSERLLLLVDQFEELFTLCRNPQERQYFVSNLLTAATEDGATTVVITLRADFYHRCADFTELRTALERHQRYIGPMSDVELRRSIEEPAQLGGWELEPGLVDLLLDDVAGEPGALPLLSHALLETWQRRRGRLLTIAGYAAAGRVQGAIALTAEREFNKLDPDGQQIARTIFLRLTELGEGREDTRRRINRSDLFYAGVEPENIQSILSQLASARLVVTSQAQSSQSVANDIFREQIEVEVAHEALIRSWPRLRDWLDDDRDGLRLHKRLGEDAREWDKIQDSGILYRSARLESAQNWAKAHISQINTLEQKFLSASQKAIDEEERIRKEMSQRELENVRNLAVEAQLRSEIEAKRAKEAITSQKRIQIFAFITILLLTTGISAAIIGIQQYRQVKGREFAEDAERLIQTEDFHLATLLAVEAQKLNYDEGTNALQRIPYQYGYASGKTIFTVHHTVDGAENSLKWDKSGNSLVAYTASNNIVSIDTSTRNISIIAHTPIVWKDYNYIQSLAWSTDDLMLGLGSSDGRIIVFNSITGEKIRELNLAEYGIDNSDHPQIIDLNWIPNNNKLVFGVVESIEVPLGPPNDRQGFTFREKDESHLFFWTIDDDNVNTVTVKDATITHLAWNHSSQHLAVAVLDSTTGNSRIIFWDIEKGAQLDSTPDFENLIEDIIWSSDGSTLAFSNQRNIILWDKKTNSQKLKIEGGYTGKLAWSPDNKILAATDNTNIGLWNVSTGRYIRMLSGHGIGDITNLIWSPDGSVLASSGTDDRIILWERNYEEHLRLFDTSPEIIQGVSWSPDGLMFATGSDNEKVTIWETSTGNELHVMNGYSALEEGIEWNPKEPELLAFISKEGGATVWNIETSDQFQVVKGNNNEINSIEWNPNGSVLAIGSRWSEGKSLIFWSLKSKSQIFPLKSEIYTDITSIAWNPTNQILAFSHNEFARNNQISIWNLNTGQKIYDLFGHTTRANGLEWDHNGKILASSVGSSFPNDKPMILWNLASGSEIQTFGKPNQSISDPSWHPDNRMIAASVSGGPVKIWDTLTHEQVATLGMPNTYVHSLAWSPDGNTLLIGGSEGRVELWTTDYVLKPICSLLLHNMSISEWRRYHPWVMYQPTCPGLPSPAMPSIIESLRTRSYVASPIPFLNDWKERFSHLMLTRQGWALIIVFVIVMLYIALDTGRDLIHFWHRFTHKRIYRHIT